MKYLLLTAVIYFLTVNCIAQNNNAGIGTINPHPSTLLELQAIDKGILIPRITDTNLVASPATGVLIYLTTNNKFYYFDGIYWKVIISGVAFNGLNGVIGITGSAGPVGNTGSSGATGIVGVTGASGLIGTTGSTGSTGATGLTGATGFDGSQSAWSLTGNNGTSPPINFLGTDDAADLIIKTNNTERMRVTANGNVGIGTSSPDNTASLHLDSSEKGFIAPRLTSALRDAIVSPAEGVLIFNTDTDCFNFYKLGAWYELCGIL